MSNDKKKVGVLGPLLTYTHQAAKQHYANDQIEIIPYKTIDDVLIAVEEGAVAEGVVPEENVIEGTVRATIDGYYNRRVYLIGKTVIPISHYIGVLPDADAKEIAEIMTKAEAFSQCSVWMGNTLPNASLIPANSTADAARIVKEKQLKKTAVIAPELALQEHGLKVIGANVGNVTYNKTMFGIVANNLRGEPTGNDETTIVIHPNQDYARQIEGYLRCFGKQGISFTRMESRPGMVSRTPSDSRGDRMTYIFPLSFKGHHRDPIVKAALTNLMMDTCLVEGTAVKLVGSHPRVDLYNGK